MRFGADAYEGVVTQWRTQAEHQLPVWTSTSHARPPAAVSYRKAPYLLTQFEARVGADRMQRILTRYMTQQIRTTPAFINVVRDAATQDAAERFRDLLRR